MLWKTMLPIAFMTITTIGCFVVSSFLGVEAQSLPFPFGNGTGDLLSPPGNTLLTNYLSLPRPMAYLTSNVTFVRQHTNGYIALYSPGQVFAGIVNGYYTDIDTRIGGANQNQVWVRIGNNASDLAIARNLIAGNGTLSNPEAIVVATWFKVEANDQQVGPKNTFQLVMAYSATGATWVISAYAQLQFYRSPIFLSAAVDLRDQNGRIVQPFFNINSNSSMARLLNGTNCNRTGVYTSQVNMAPTKAPSKVPRKAPTKLPTKALTLAPISTKCGSLGWSLFCPRTLCGIFGRWLGLCQSK
jgi:hypothetical protein